jgi:hypothetical protein
MRELTDDSRWEFPREQYHAQEKPTSSTEKRANSDYARTCQVESPVPLIVAEDGDVSLRNMPVQTLIDFVCAGLKNLCKFAAIFRHFAAGGTEIVQADQKTFRQR